MSINVYPDDARDFYLKVQQGSVPANALVHKFGRNDGVPNGTWELIAQTSAATAFRSSAATMRIKAGGNAADDAAGAGAREVTIQGIDDNLAEVSETITTAGASASTATTALFWRVHRAWVSSAGTYGAANTGLITIEDSAGAADMILITAGEGQSQYAAYTIETGKTAYLLSCYFNVDAAKAADIRLFTRANFNDVTAPVSSIRLKRHWDGVLGSFKYYARSPSLVLPALTDIWLEARGSGAGTEVSAQFELLMVG